MDKPSLSVIVASYNSLCTIRACLASLRQQDFAGSFEVILVDSGADSAAELVGREFPEVTVVARCRRTYPGVARNLGVARARGDILCFLDADCVASRDWLKAICEAHARPDPVIGGAIANGAASGLVAWASYFAEFSHCLPVGPVRRLPTIASSCLSLKRWIVDDIGPFGQGAWATDTAYCLRLTRAGYPQPLFDPGIKVSHHGITKLRRFIVHQVELGRGYGQIRVAVERFGVLRRTAYTLALPLIWLVLCVRVARRALKNRGLAAKFIPCSPLVFLGLMAWTVGEAGGYVQGKPAVEGPEGVV